MPQYLTTTPALRARLAHHVRKALQEMPGKAGTWSEIRLATQNSIEKYVTPTQAKNALLNLKKKGCVGYTGAGETRIYFLQGDN